LRQHHTCSPLLFPSTSFLVLPSFTVITQFDAVYKQCVGKALLH
jgi:hypothetical protein